MTLPHRSRHTLVLHSHRIDLTLSSRRRRRIEGRSPSTRSRCAPALPRYGARARLLGMRVEFRRASPNIFGTREVIRARTAMRFRHFPLEDKFRLVKEELTRLRKERLLRMRNILARNSSLLARNLPPAREGFILKAASHLAERAAVGHQAIAVEDDVARSRRNF